MLCCVFTIVVTYQLSDVIAKIVLSFAMNKPLVSAAPGGVSDP